ncbi:MAG: hypothetical protein LBT05_02560 [Planctomycetaceae bacterium]|jgi:hypothetical protein|nr:hypothetical protein [Planctomycetaceae bacterium]
MRDRQQQLKNILNVKPGDEYEIIGQASKTPYRKAYQVYPGHYEEDLCAMQGKNLSLADRETLRRAGNPITEEDLARSIKTLKLDDMTDAAAGVREIQPLESELDALRRSESFFNHYTDKR